jgi:PBSX family phage terminase large subunit
MELPVPTIPTLSDDDDDAGPVVEIDVHDKQGEFYESTALYRAFIGGRGSGKSYIGAVDILSKAQPGRRYMVIAPTYTMLSDVTLQSVLEVGRRLNLIDEKKIKLGAPPQIVTRSGATILFRSGDRPDRLRGPNLSGVWLDESGQMSEEVYLIAIASLREGGELGWLTTTSTPVGFLHWTYETFGKNKPNTFLVRASTRDNPFVHDEFVETIIGQYGQGTLWAQQEIEGEFVALEGAEWPAAYFTDDIWVEAMPENLTMRVMACDPSKGIGGKFGDYSAIVALGRGQDGKLYVQADMDNVRDAERIVYQILDCHKTWRADVIAIESDMFQDLFAVLLHNASTKTGIMAPVKPQPTEGVPKEVRIRRLTPYLSRKNLRFVKDKGTELLVNQLQQFPLGDHDDGPDALEQAIRAATALWYGRQEKPVKGYR